MKLSQIFVLKVLSHPNLETCMVGLCATCICTHTEYHVNNKSTP